MVERITTAYKKATRQGGLKWQGQLTVFCISCALIVSHRPDAVRNAQFYAEDGMVWFAQAHNSGWLHSLLSPQNGYFQTLPRAAAGLALLVPLRWAPLTMNLVGLIVQVLPVSLLLSNRLSNLGPFPLRALWAIAYLGLPNAQELEITVTEGEFHLALLTCLVILAKVPATPWWRLFDIGVMLLGGLTGPFCIFLLPAAGIYWYLRRERWRVIPVLVLTVPTLIQLSALLRTAAAARSQAPLGVTPRLFLELVAGRVYMAALWGHSSLRAQQHLALLLLVTLAGSSIVLYSLWKARVELRLLILFGFVMLGLAMARPQASYVSPQWKVLSTAAGHHYWFLPMIAFVWCLLWCSLEGESSRFRNVARLLAFTIPLGIMRDWHYPAYEDMQYQTQVRQFELAQAGTPVAIPIFPRGWVMTLIKKSAGCSIYPEGVIDSPKNGSTVSGIVQVAGWTAATDRHVRRVWVKVDDQPAKILSPQIARPDVDRVHPDSLDKEKGWQTEFDFSSMAPGKHRIEVSASEDSGCTAAIAQVTVERTR